MKYGSEILEMIHENATINFKLGFISEAEMREYDKECLVPEIFQDNNVNNETVSMEHAELVTV